ncbi:hypothetical protein [Streptomyces sp. NPDC004324]
MFIVLMYGALLAVPLWTVAVLVKGISVALPGRRPDWARDLALWCAAMAAAAAVIVYSIGLGSVEWDADAAESGASSSPAEPCRSLSADALDHLAGHEPSYFPLGFSCVLDDGSEVAGNGDYPWLNGLAAAFTLGAGALVIGVHLRDGLRTRATAKARPRPAPQGRD